MFYIHFKCTTDRWYCSCDTHMC